MEQAILGVSSGRATRQASPVPLAPAMTTTVTDSSGASSCQLAIKFIADAARTASATISSANSVSPALPATTFAQEPLPFASADVSATSSPPTTFPVPLSLAIPPLPPTEGALPDWLQTEWQGWCDSLMTDEWGALLQEDGEWPSLPGMG